MGLDTGVGLQQIGTNWSGNYAYRATRLHHPRTLAALQELVRGADRIRPLGTRHSFTSMADSAELVSLSELEGVITVDQEAGTVSVPAATTYATLAAVLNDQGLALHNLASLPHISVAGAVATATHGSGDTYGNLATAVTGLELVRADGEVVFVARGEETFEGLVVGLGALGIVTQVVLETEPFYTVRQRVYESLSWEALSEHYDEITGQGESVSVFHRFGPATEQVWVKRRAGRGRASTAGRGPVRSSPCRWAPQPGTGERSGQHHRATRCARSVVRATAPLSQWLHAERRGGDPV